MKISNKKSLVIVLVAVLSIFALVGCSAPAQEAPAQEEPAEEAADPAPAEEPAETIEGPVIIDGSGTVYPLMAHLAEVYMTEEQPDVSVQVGRAGSSAGFKMFIPGELDFSDASRQIKDSEVEQLKEKGWEMGKDILEFKVALDGLTMVINPENDWAVEMTNQEIVDMYLSGTYNADDVVLWSDIRPEWPSEEINFYGPNENHGTFEFFYENILGKQDMVKTANLQQEYSTLVDLVSKDKYAIAFFGFGYYVSNTDKLTAVKVDFGNGPVEPSLETIGEDLPYAGFTRPVFTYLNAAYAAEKPQVLDFAKFIVSPEGAQKYAGENGFAPLPAEVFEGYMTQLEAIK
ncbi:MAG: phosphate ABC transporter phosphate-binding protein [delta proteobacterium ML8_F1]|nr:MAG: phosphate ABC transporter phosphate-binding protein [delta proteobacterium ML8_F1]